MSSAVCASSMNSRLCMKMLSFLFVRAWVMPRTLYLPCGDPFPIWTPDNISSLISVVLWLSRWEVMKKKSGNILFKWGAGKMIFLRSIFDVVFFFDVCNEFWFFILLILYFFNIHFCFLIWSFFSSFSIFFTLFFFFYIFYTLFDLSFFISIFNFPFKLYCD